MLFRYCAGAALIALADPALAAERVPPIREVELTPLLDTRMRFESVEQGALEAEALTVRLRPGIEANLSGFSLLAEVEGTVALVKDYNAFPFPRPGERQWRPQYAVIADPENLELNRLQLQYKGKSTTLTMGRQRINLDDQRWVGSVGWRQNEQTFDAVRTEAGIGPLKSDLTYAISQRTIFGEDAGPRTALDGDFIFAGLGSKVGSVEGKLFAYLLDYDEGFFKANSSQTYGALLSGSVPLGGPTRVTLRASYARQSDYGGNPFDYAADYWSLEGGVTLAGFMLAAGWEQLGSDNGRAVQTPMATLHKFNGWADLFLSTPASGLRDSWISIGRKFDRVKLLPGLNFTLVHHRFDSARGGIGLGSEWDASVGFKAGKIGFLVKLADYDAKGFGADTRKLWLQLEWSP